MPEGEEMFKYHGYSGPCPKPPLQKPTIEALVEYIHRETDGKFWLDIRCNKELWGEIGPFSSTAERQLAHDDMLQMMRSCGASDLPRNPQ